LLNEKSFSAFACFFNLENRHTTVIGYNEAINEKHIGKLVNVRTY